MPRLHIDYSKTIIYKLVCRDLSVKELYVGATTNWVNRKGSHKCRCTNENNKKYHLKVYQYIRANGSWENWNMIMVEEYSCETEHESAKRERHWTETLGATLNSNTPSRTYTEYCEENKEQINKRQIKYTEQNKELISKKNKEKITCICNSVCSRASIPSHNKTQKHINFLNFVVNLSQVY
jgi:hypothetical protein